MASRSVGTIGCRNIINGEFLLVSSMLAFQQKLMSYRSISVFTSKHAVMPHTQRTRRNSKRRRQRPERSRQLKNPRHSSAIIAKESPHRDYSFEVTFRASTRIYAGWTPLFLPASRHIVVSRLLYSTRHPSPNQGAFIIDGQGPWTLFSRLRALSCGTLVHPAHCVAQVAANLHMSVSTPFVLYRI